MNRRLLIPAIMSGLSLIILIGLGAWQWQRRGEKLALIQTIDARMKAAPLAIAPSDAWNTFDVAGHTYRSVRATGVFDHTKEAHVFFSIPKGAAFSGPGYLILTPLRLEAGGTVLVNRGFVPAERKDPATRSAGQFAGPIAVEGLLRAPENRNAFAGANDAAKNIFFVRDPAAIAAAKSIGPVAPFILDLVSPTPPGGLPQTGSTQIDIPNNHLQYAMTWWGLAAVLCVIFLVFARQRPR